MPFTLSHAAAVLPLRRIPVLAHLPLSALAIGSMVPDLGFLLPGMDRHFSHGFAGLWLFCLPMGWLVWALFRHMLQLPLLNLMPRPLERRLLVQRAGEVTNFWSVSLALLLGAASHLVWDGITHDDGFIAAQLAFLRWPVAQLGERVMPLCDLLQHLSSLLGLALIGRHALRWSNQGAPDGGREAWRRLRGMAFLFGVPLLVAALHVLAWLPAARAELILAMAAGRALETGGVCLLGYALLWQAQHGRWRWLRWRGRTGSSAEPARITARRSEP